MTNRTFSTMRFSAQERYEDWPGPSFRFWNYLVSDQNIFQVNLKDVFRLKKSEKFFG